MQIEWDMDVILIPISIPNWRRVWMRTALRICFAGLEYIWNNNNNNNKLGFVLDNFAVFHSVLFCLPCSTLFLSTLRRWCTHTDMCVMFVDMLMCYKLWYVWILWLPFCSYFRCPVAFVVVLFRYKLPNEKFETIFHSFVVVVMDALFDTLQMHRSGYTCLLSCSIGLWRYSQSTLKFVLSPVEILNWILFSAVYRVCSCWQYSVEVLKLHARLQGIWQLSALDSDALHLFSFDLIRCNSIYLLSPLVLLLWLLLLLLLLPRNQQKPTKNNNNEWKIDACTIWQKLTNEKRKTTNNKMSKNEKQKQKQKLFVPISFPKWKPLSFRPCFSIAPTPLLCSVKLLKLWLGWQLN